MSGVRFISYGWHKKRLFFDLSSEKISKTAIGEDYLKMFLGGRGINIETLYRMSSHVIDPFNPSAPLIFSTGPITTGTNVPASCR